MDYPNTSSSPQARLNIYSSMRATPPTSTDKLSLDPEPSKPYKTTAKKHTDSDEQSKEPDPQANDLLINPVREELRNKLLKELHKDPNEAKQRLGKELLALLEIDDNVRRLREGFQHKKAD